jgi:hypothetical protein
MEACFMDSENSSSFFSSVQMEKLFQETFDPLLAKRGFQYVGKNRWVRDLGAGFKHLFYLYPFRPGADYYPHGAISFDYVPRIERGRVRLRPGPKYTRVHLAVAGYRLGSDRAIDRNPENARKKSLEIGEAVVDSVDNSLRSFRSLDDVLAKFRRNKLDSPSGFYCYPESALAFAFTLAVLGHITEAKAELARTLQNSYFDPEIHSDIAALLNESAPSSLPSSGESF